MRNAQICQSRCYFRMLLPVVLLLPVELLLDCQGTLVQVLRSTKFTQLPMRTHQNCQGCCYFDVQLPLVLLLDPQGTLEQVLLLSVVAQVSMRHA